MAFPVGVSVAIIEAGRAFTSVGSDVSMSAKVTPIFRAAGGGAMKRIVHAATGHPMLASTEEFKAEAGSVLSFAVPHVDQPGWQAPSGEAYTMWYYAVEITARVGNGRNATGHVWKQNVQPLVGQDFIDLDLIADGPTGEPVTAPHAVVTSVDGQTGAVTLGPVVGTAIDQAVADGRIPQPVVSEPSPGVYEIGEGGTVYGLTANGDLPAATIGGLDTRYAPEGGGKPVGKGELVVNVRDYGAKGDGVADDGAAIRAARTAAAGRVLFFPAGTYRYVATGGLGIAANTTWRGVPGSSKILFESTGHTAMFFNQGHNAALEGLEIVRNTNFPAVYLTVNGFDNLTIRDCVFDGRKDVFADYCHGIQLGSQSSATTRNILVENTQFLRMSFGLFQTNVSTGITRGVTFRGCLFRDNYATDLEFNSPVTDTFNVLVEGCRFLDNKLTSTGAGFGVGLAHVTGAIIRGNVFDGYANEAVHIEDYSTDTVVEGNSFKRCAKERAAYIRVISGASNIIIANNNIDARDNTVKVLVIQSTLGGAGGGVTPGGRSDKDPFNITIQGNRVLAGVCDGIYLSFATNSVVANNTLIGAGTVASLVYNEINTGFGIDIWGGTGNSVRGNQIRGFKWATPRRTTGTSTGGDAFVLSENTVEDCRYGLSLVNPGTCVVSGNMIRNTVHPMLLGQGPGTAKPAVIVGNHADANKHPMEIGGTLILVPSASAASGATSLFVEPLGLAITASHVFTFPNGAVFTPSAGGASAGATTVSGTLSGGSVAAGDVGKASNVWHSWTGANNRVAISGNIDSVAKLYGGQVTHSPNGTRYRVSVSDAGALTAVAF